MSFTSRGFCDARAAACMLIAAALTACGGVASSIPAGTAPAALRAHPAAASSPLPSELAFVPDGTGSVPIYDFKNPQAGVVGLIDNYLPGLQHQSTVDAQGNFYVASTGSGFFDPKQYYVAKFAPPYTGRPFYMRTKYHGLFFSAIGVTVDAKGTTYVSTCGGYCVVNADMTGVFVYPRGHTYPKRLITSPKFNSLGFLTVDSHGNVYGLNWNDKTSAADAFEIPAGSSTPEFLNLHGFYSDGNSTGGITVDSAGDLWITNPSAAGAFVLEFKPGAHYASHQIQLGAWLPQLLMPMGLQFGPDGNLYVAMYCGAPGSSTCPQVYAFAPNGEKPVRIFGTQSVGVNTDSISIYPNVNLESAGGAR